MVVANHQAQQLSWEVFLNLTILELGSQTLTLHLVRSLFLVDQSI